MPVVKAPFLPPLNQLGGTHKQYTLVLDLDETLIHFVDSEKHANGESFFRIRPFCIEFLEEMS
jgi:predicted HAD superfamily phosphohydrolase YqeG